MGTGRIFSKVTSQKVLGKFPLLQKAVLTIRREGFGEFIVKAIDYVKGNKDPATQAANDGGSNRRTDKNRLPGERIEDIGKERGGLQHRTAGYTFLKGHGLEIGALSHPAAILAHCTVDFCDCITKEQAINLFPEVPPDTIVNPRYICDLDKNGLLHFRNEQFDFVILNHIIEHVANPMNVIGEIFRIVRFGGYVVVSCPDKRFTFDKHRELTLLNHLMSEFRQEVKTVTDDHYIDFLSKVHPDIMKLPDDQIKAHLERVRSRREHAHVWDSDSFKAFMVASLSLFGEDSTCMYEVCGDETQFEYFSVWKRNKR